jgi:hypothetical protein
MFLRSARGDTTVHVLKWNRRDFCLKGIPTCLHICTQCVPYIHLFRYFFLALERLPDSGFLPLPNKHGEAGGGGGIKLKLHILHGKELKTEQNPNLLFSMKLSHLLPFISWHSHNRYLAFLCCLRLSFLCVAGRGIASVSRVVGLGEGKLQLRR